MKRIIVCADGTWNKAEIDQEDGGKPTSTNVAKIAAIVSQSGAEVEQVVIYLEGVGSSDKEKLTGGAFGWGLNRNINIAYRRICACYQPGDTLYFFGFSRGAYTVRSLASLIGNSGIVRNLDDANAAIQLYRDKTDSARSGSVKSRLFRAQYSWEVDVLFVGVWDTVGALGLPLIKHSIASYLGWAWNFHSPNFDHTVLNAYHALAKNEQRSQFQPVLHESRPDSQMVVERWFHGVHSDVGGGYRENGLSNITLRWMVAKAQSHGLEFKADWHSILSIGPKNQLESLTTAAECPADPFEFMRHNEWRGIYKVTDKLRGFRNGHERKADPATTDDSVGIVEGFLSTTFEVKARRHWNKSPFIVRAGETYQIDLLASRRLTAFGRPYRAPVNSNSKWSMRLAKLARFPEAPMLALVVCIDRDQSNMAVLGVNRDLYKAHKDGTLHFFVNNVAAGYWALTGSIAVRVTQATTATNEAEA